VVFLNLYNNQWNTNYRYWYQVLGIHEYASGLATNSPAALETMVPLLASAGSGARDHFPQVSQGLACRVRACWSLRSSRSQRQSELLAGLGIRGESGKNNRETPFRITRTHRQTFEPTRRFAGPPIAVQAGSFEFLLGRFAPASFEVE